MSNFYNKTGVQALEEMHSSSCGLSAEEAAKTIDADNKDNDMEYPP